MTLKTIAALVLFALIGLVYLNVNASKPIAVKLTKLSTGDSNTAEILVKGMKDNADGTVTLAATACGNLMEFTIDKADIDTKGFEDEFSRVFFNTIEKVCQ